MRALAAVADDFEGFAVAERPLDRLLDFVGIAGFQVVGHRARRHSAASAAGAETCKGRHDLARETAQLLAAAGDGEQDIVDAGVLQGFEHGADFVRRAEQRVLLGAAGLVGIGEHMRAALAVRPARHIDGALGIGGLANQRGLLVGLVLGDVKLARHRDLHRIESAKPRASRSAL